MMCTRSLGFGNSPCRVVEPECGAAFRAEIALAGRDFAFRAFVVDDLGTIDAEISLPRHLQRIRDAAKVDGVAATALLLAADRAVAEHEGRRRVALDLEFDRAAAARTFQQ
jgi:hypothetical protein